MIRSIGICDCRLCDNLTVIYPEGSITSLNKRELNGAIDEIKNKEQFICFDSVCSIDELDCSN